MVSILLIEHNPNIITFIGIQQFYQSRSRSFIPALYRHSQNFFLLSHPSYSLTHVHCVHSTQIITVHSISLVNGTVIGHVMGILFYQTLAVKIHAG